MTSSDYLRALRHCRSPQKAATYIRAFITSTGCIFWGNKAAAYDALMLAEQRAQQLERPYENQDGEPLAKPWRQWLKEWGYV